MKQTSQLPQTLMEQSLGLQDESDINKEREENVRFYKEHEAELYQNYAGKYVVIAKGRIQAVGSSFDEIDGVALDAQHRYVFQVVPKGPTKVRLRWPIRIK
jgi:hypothetical protein